MTTQIAAPVGPEQEGPIISPFNWESDNNPLAFGTLGAVAAGVVLLTACDQAVVATEPQPGVFDGITTAEMLQATGSLRELTVRWTGTDGTREEIQINAVGFVVDAKTGELIQLRPLSGEGEPRSYAFAQALQLDEKGQIIKELPLLVEEKDNVRTVFLLVSSNPAPPEQGEKKVVSLLRVNNGTLEATTKQLFVFVNADGKTTLAISDGDSQQELRDATASKATPTGVPEAVIELLSFSAQESIVDNPIVSPTAPATPSPASPGVALAQETVGAEEAEVPDVPPPTEPPATPTGTNVPTAVNSPTPRSIEGQVATPSPVVESTPGRVATPSPNERTTDSRKTGIVKVWNGTKYEARTLEQQGYIISTPVGHWEAVGKVKSSSNGSVVVDFGTSPNAFGALNEPSRQGTIGGIRTFSLTTARFLLRPAILNDEYNIPEDFFVLGDLAEGDWIRIGAPREAFEGTGGNVLFVWTIQ